jgi:hypothetical protein
MTNRWKNIEEIKPETEEQVLICFNSHFGEAFSVGSYQSTTEEWYVISDRDGTMDIAEIEPVFWAKIVSPGLA